MMHVCVRVRACEHVGFSVEPEVTLIMGTTHQS